MNIDDNVSRFDALDRAILQALPSANPSGKHFCALVHNAQCRREAGLLGKEPSRQIDRRLQSLRKRGFIKYNRFYGWRIA